MIVYINSADNRRLDLRVLQYLPRYFNGTEVNLSGALKEMIETQLKKAA